MGTETILAIITMPTVIATVAIYAGARTRMNRDRLDHALKQQMVDRGMSADEIVAVLSRPSCEDRGASLPCASEVVVYADDEWQTALVLKRDEDRFFVHVVGTDMSENRWVDRRNVRLPVDEASSSNGDSAWCSLGKEWLCGDGRHYTGGAKPAGVDQDL